MLCKYTSMYQKYVSFSVFPTYSLKRIFVVTFCQIWKKNSYCLKQIQFALFYIHWDSFFFENSLVEYDILSTTRRYILSGQYILQYSSRKIFFGMLILYLENLRLKIFNYNVKKARGILKLSIQVFSKSVKGLFFNGCWFSMKYIMKGKKTYFWHLSVVLKTLFESVLFLLKWFWTKAHKLKMTSKVRKARHKEFVTKEIVNSRLLTYFLMSIFSLMESKFDQNKFKWNIFNRGVLSYIYLQYVTYFNEISRKWLIIEPGKIQHVLTNF